MAFHWARLDERARDATGGYGCSVIECEYMVEVPPPIFLISDRLAFMSPTKTWRTIPEYRFAKRQRSSRIIFFPLILLVWCVFPFYFLFSFVRQCKPHSSNHIHLRDPRPIAKRRTVRWTLLDLIGEN